MRGLHVMAVAICGVLTNLWCESTARDAYYRDCWTYFLADATGTQNEEMHRASLLNLAYGFACITTTKDVISQLQKDAGSKGSSRVKAR